MGSKIILTDVDGVILDWELQINKGRGYVPSELNQKEDMPIGTIFIDSKL